MNAVTLIASLFILSGVIVMAFGFWQIIQARASLSWPTAEGRVTHSELAEREMITYAHEPDRYIYWAEVTYEYTVDGQALTSTRVCYADVGTGKRERHQPIVDRYPVGTPVKVHYHPEKPETACLEPGGSRVTWIMPGAGAFFLILGLLIYWLTKRG